MTIQQLQYLVAIAQNNSINSAAQSLFVSQSNLSKAIKQLETELGFQILERRPRGVAFTNRGLEFLQDTYKLVEHYDTFKSRYSNEANESMNFSVSSQHYIFVLVAVAQMASELEGLGYTIRLRERKTSEIIDDVLSRRSHIGFIYYYDITSAFILRELERFNLVFHPFCTALPHVYLSKRHPLANEKKLTLSQLEPYLYVCYDMDTDSNHFAEEVFSPPHPQQTIYVTDRSSMFNIITHTYGYTLGSGYLYPSFIGDDIVTIPIAAPETSIMHIGWIELQQGNRCAQVLPFVQRCKQILSHCYTGSARPPRDNVPRRSSGLKPDLSPWHLP